MKKTLIAAALFAAAVAHAQNVTVSANARIVQKPGVPRPGEAQSTVVPPGVKSQCTAGRFLVTNDSLRPPAKGLVTGRDLDKPFGAGIAAAFDNPSGQLHSFVTNDHDLVVLNNGDVLYLTGAASREAVNVPWFDLAYRGTFGPGARSVLLTWRSTDCGETFHYLGEFDPARIGDGSCAYPQFRRDSNGKIIEASPYDMGGADGQTIHVDRTNNRLYLTFSCVGFQPFNKKPFTLNPEAPLNKTLVATSDDAGAHWHQLGFIDYGAWRLNTVPLPGGSLGFGIANGVLVGNKNAAGYSFDSQYSPASTSWAWSGFPLEGGLKNPWFWTNIFGHTLAARTPGSDDFFIAFAVTSGKAYGYRLSFYDRTKKAFADAADDIVPAKSGPSNFIMHPVVIDNGSGPVLLYWNDVDLDAQKVTVRGRFIFGTGSYSSDFVISRDASGQPRSFAVVKKGPPGDWYGDYQTAGGFRHGVGFGAYGAPGALDVYYPMWIEAGGVIRFARVQIAEKGQSPNLRRIVLGPQQWHPQEAARSLSNVRRVEIREHE